MLARVINAVVSVHFTVFALKSWGAGTGISSQGFNTGARIFTRIHIAGILGSQGGHYNLAMMASITSLAPTLVIILRTRLKNKNKFNSLT